MRTAGLLLVTGFAAISVGVFLMSVEGGLIVSGGLLVTLAALAARES